MIIDGKKVAAGLRTDLGEKEEALRLEYRSGFHDLMANDRGFDPYSEFQFLKGSLLYLQDQKKFRADSFSLVEIISLDPWSKISRSLSWKVGARIERMDEFSDCRFCHRTRLFGKLGISFGERDFIFGIFGGGTVDYSTHYENYFQVSTNAEIFMGHAFKYAKAMLGVDAYFNVEGLADDFYQRIFLRTNFFLSKNNELRVEASEILQGNHFDDVTHNLSLEWGLYL